MCCVHRTRRRALPAEPATAADVVVSGPWTTTGGPQPQPFLICDSGATPADRMFVFAAPEQLRHLATADTWYMDGNFAMSPRIFTQLYVIRAALGDSAVTCVYAFLAGVSKLQKRQLWSFSLMTQTNIRLYVLVTILDVVVRSLYIKVCIVAMTVLEVG